MRLLFTLLNFKGSMKQCDLVNQLTYSNVHPFTKEFYRFKTRFASLLERKAFFKSNGGNGFIFSFRVTDCEQTKSFKFRERLLCHKAINTLKGKHRIKSMLFHKNYFQKNIPR